MLKIKLKFLIILYFVFFTLNINCSEINILDIFVFKLPNNIEIKEHEELLFYNKDNKENQIMVRIDYYCLLENKDFYIYFYLKPKENINLNDLKKKYNKFELINASTNFGFGDQYKLLKDWGKEIKTKNNIKMIRFISSWGGRAKDLLGYNFDLNTRYFDSCLINFKDVWSLYNEGIPTKLSDAVEEALKKGDKKVEIYRKLDEAMDTLKFINKANDKNNKSITYFSPNIDNLRFRETPTLDGKFIRMLNKGEYLELLEKGKMETINNVKGIWVKVKTEKGEVGWCFDAYLEEVKKK